MTKRRKMLSLDEADALEDAEMAEHGNEFAGEEPDPVGLAQAPVDSAWDDEIAPPSSFRDRALTALCIAIIIGWVGFSLWARQDMLLAGTAPAMWSSLIFELVVPPLLVVIAWQLAIRSGRAEQARFADTAQMLSVESASLETRLTAVNRELSLARDFIASQSRDLESLGRVAAERLTSSAETLQGLIAVNGERVDAIGTVSSNAVTNMEKLRDQLPVLANSARDMTNQIGNVGNVAERHVSELAGSMKTLEELGSTGESHVERIASLVAEAVSEIDRHTSAMGSTALTTLETLNRQSDDFQQALFERDKDAIAETQNRATELAAFLDGRNERLFEIEEKTIKTMRERVASLAQECDTVLAQMGGRRDEVTNEVFRSITELEERLVGAINRVSEVDADALANARKRLSALATEAARLDASFAESASSFDADFARRQQTAQERQIEALSALEDRLAQFDQRISERESDHFAHVETLAERGQQLAEHLARVDADIGALGGKFDETNAGIGASADLLAERLATTRATLDENGGVIARLTDESVRLLEILQSSGEQTDGPLTASIDRAQQRLGLFQTNAEALRELMEQAEGRGATLAGHVETARDRGSNTLDLLEQLEGQLSAIAEKSSALAAQTRDELQASIDTLKTTSVQVVEDLRAGQSDAIRDIAGQIAEQSNSAIAEALNHEAKATIAQLEAAAQRASEAGVQTTTSLRDQLAVVNELAGNLEQRVATARTRAEEQIDHDFTRRMASITEALNSSAIDISSVFENEVTDLQWSNYLRGDRGIFTRRAVRLLDKQEARSVHEVYQEDSEFRETVNRYIHDFEAMLRSVLSTRDGNAVAVTLLSSDIGKLYVSLAQAIDRLRE